MYFTTAASYSNKKSQTTTFLKKLDHSEKS